MSVTTKRRRRRRKSRRKDLIYLEDEDGVREYVVYIDGNRVHLRSLEEDELGDFYEKLDKAPNTYEFLVKTAKEGSKLRLLGVADYDKFIEALEKEGVDPDSIYFDGNVVLEALKEALPRRSHARKIIEKVLREGKELMAVNYSGMDGEKVIWIGIPETYYYNGAPISGYEVLFYLIIPRSEDKIYIAE